MLDIKVPGLNLPGPRPDQFRVSSEVMKPAAVAAMREMVKDLALRGEIELLRARAERRISTVELYRAFRGTEGSLSSLKQALNAVNQRLEPEVTEWAKRLNTKDKVKTEIHVRRFVQWLEETNGRPAQLTDITANNINDFLSDLKSRRSNPPRELDPQTKDRYRAAVGGFCTYLEKHGKITAHPVKEGDVPLWNKNPHRRLPRCSRKEYEDYFDAVGLMRTDLPTEEAEPLREACTVFLRMLWHTGGDVSEVRRLIVDDITWPEEASRQIEGRDALAMIRLKRTKTKTPERYVPYPPEHVAELRRFVERQGLKHDGLVFGCLRQVVGRMNSYLPDIQTAHRTAVKRMGREIRIKDLRHLAAISWARADVRIEQIKTWLGHSTINQTMIYSDFLPSQGEIFHKIVQASRLGATVEDPS